jgi:hypothetical protein
LHALAATEFTGNFQGNLHFCRAQRAMRALVDRVARAVLSISLLALIRQLLVNKQGYQTRAEAIRPSPCQADGLPEGPKMLGIFGAEADAL